jgi:hypothetical protein
VATANLLRAIDICNMWPDYEVDLDEIEMAFEYGWLRQPHPDMFWTFAYPEDPRNFRYEKTGPYLWVREMCWDPAKIKNGIRCSRYMTTDMKENKMTDSGDPVFFWRNHGRYGRAVVTY